jgi:hypothetical protein
MEQNSTILSISLTEKSVSRKNSKQQDGVCDCQRHNHNKCHYAMIPDHCSNHVTNLPVNEIDGDGHAEEHKCDNVEQS